MEMIARTSRVAHFPATLLLSCCLLGLSASPGVRAAGPDSPSPAPLVLYTDITSGPNSGGENNKGIYLSIFGVGFGSSLSSVKVLIGGAEVDNYRYLGPSRGRPDVQQITVQVGALGNPPAGSPLPVQVVVDGAGSNTDQTFTVNPGNIYFVAPNGVDTNGTRGGGTFEAPFRTVQKPAGVRLAFMIAPASVGGAFARVQAGDFIVLRQGTYSDVGFGGSGGEGYFMQTLNKSGCPLGVRCAQGGGSGTGPITLMGYPGETAFIDRTNHLGDHKFGGGISSADSARQALGYGAWWNIVDLKIESGFYDGPIDTQRGDQNPLGGHWRIVNNELSADSCQINICRAGAIAGAGSGEFWVGNYAHDVYDKPSAGSALENHGVYIIGAGSFEIAYNTFARIVGGNGIQIYSPVFVDDVSIHHNIIHDVGKHGLNIVDGSRNNIVIWSNLVYNTAYAGVRLGSDELHDLKLYNNTFYNTGMMGDTPSSGSLTNDMSAGKDQLDIRNNIFWPHPGSGYNRGAGNAELAGPIGPISHNLWYGGSGANPGAGFSSDSLNADPRFASVTPGREDFHLQDDSPALAGGTRAVAALVTTDIELRTVTQSNGPREPADSFHIGAYAR
jgi:hypothetical protein